MAGENQLTEQQQSSVVDGRVKELAQVAARVVLAHGEQIAAAAGLSCVTIVIKLDRRGRARTCFLRTEAKIELPGANGVC